MTKRLGVLLFAATVLASLAWADRGDGSDMKEVVEPAKVAARQEKGDKMPVLELDRLRARPETKAELDAFAAKSWYVAPPPPPEPKHVEKPKPKAPPLPFAYMGRFQEESGKPIIYLVRDNRTFVVRTGDIIDDAYRIEKITPQEVVFTYLPMSQVQTLNIGPVS